MTALAAALSAGGPFAAPNERGRFAVPAFGRGFQGVDDLLRRFRRLAIQSTAHDNALDGFGHVEPGAAQGRVERHDALLDEPQDHVWRVVTGQIVPHQQHAQRRQQLGQRNWLRQSLLPTLPQSSLCRRITSGWGWQGAQDRRTLFLEPGMQDRIGGTGHALGHALRRSGDETRSAFWPSHCGRTRALGAPGAPLGCQLVPG